MRRTYPSVWVILLGTIFVGWVTAVISGMAGMNLTWVFRVLVVFQISLAVGNLIWCMYHRVEQGPVIRYWKLDPWMYLLVSALVCLVMGFAVV